MKAAIPILIGISILILATAGRASAQKGNEIKVYCDGRDLRPVIQHLNTLIASESVRFQLVDDDADVTVMFRDDIGDPKAVGISYPLLGWVYISNSLPADQVYVVLIHEFLHCAGVGHEPEDPSSVMYTNSQRTGQIKKRHVQALRRLIGIGLFGRIGSQFSLIF